LAAAASDHAIDHAMIDDASSHRGIGATPSSSALSAALS
jgi:hypothetical protein